jgi:hypothetical protein
MLHNLCDFIKDELKELDRKVASGGKLSMSEIEYADKLAHMKKSLLTVDAMENPNDYGYNDGYANHSYSARRGRGSYVHRDSMGRYADMRGGYRDDSGFVDELHELMEKAPNERVRKKFESFISDVDMM